MNMNRTRLMLRVAVVSLGVWSVFGQESRYFRVAGPVTTSLTGFSADGYISWTNAPTNATFLVQVASGLTGPSNWVDYVQVPATSGATRLRLVDLHPPTNMALVPAGNFTMGDSLDGYANALPTHPVYVSAFYMDKYDVTKALWDEVYNWAIVHGYSFYSWGYVAGGKATNHPVQNINWYDSLKWCNARSEKEGKVPAYYTDAGQTVVYRTGDVAVANDSVKWNAGYRLPTEAEWEKAARGGLSGKRFPWGNTISESLANYYSGTGAAYDLSQTGYNPTYSVGNKPYTNPVGSFAPNGYGLYDMVGNVFQKCWDVYDPDYYTAGLQSDPHGSSASYVDHVQRGGAWGNAAFYSLTAYRTPIGASGINYDQGFRTVLPAGQ